MDERLLEAIRYFTDGTRIMDGLTVVCGDRDRLRCAWKGEHTGEHAVCDLASVTKLFTGLSAMRLKEEGLLDPDRPVTFYDDRFSRLEDVTVGQIMSFTVNLQTPGRIDACRDRDEALRCLFGAAPAGPTGRRAYSDIPAMALGCVLERIAGMKLADCVSELVLRPAGMTETWAKVPEDRLRDCMLYGPEYRIEKGRRIVRRDIRAGVPHDPKAALLQGADGTLCGHAGLFSTAADLTRFCRAVLDERIVSGESLREIAVNRTGRRLEDGTYTQYLGYMCYLKHPDQYFSEIPAYMGHRAFGIGGFTGNHLSVDPEKGIFAIFLGNRVRNRLTVLLPEDGKDYTDYGLRADGVGMYRWEDGTALPSSVNYVHQKDGHLHRVVAEVMGWPEENT